MSKDRNDYNVSLEPSENGRDEFSDTDILLIAINTGLTNYKKNFNRFAKTFEIDFLLKPITYPVENKGNIVAQGALRLYMIKRNLLTESSEEKLVWAQGVGFTDIRQIGEKEWFRDLLVNLISEFVGCLHIMIDAGKEAQKETFREYVKRAANDKRLSN